MNTRTITYVKFLLAFLLSSSYVAVSIASIISDSQVDSLNRIIASEKVDTLKFQHYNKLIDILFDEDKELCIEPLKEQLKIAESIGDKSKMGKVRSSLGGVYMSLGQSSEAYDYLHSAQTIFAELGNNTELSYLLNDIALLHQRENRYEEAIQSYQELIFLSDSLNDYIGEMFANVNLMSLFMDINDPVKGLDYGKNAIAVSNRIPSELEEEKETYNSYLSAIYLNMGLCYSDKTNYDADSALLYLDMAYASLSYIDDEYSTTYYNGYIDNSKGDLLYERSQLSSDPSEKLALLKSALQTFTSAQESLIEVSDSRGETITYNNIGKILNQLERYKEARASLNKGLELGLKIDFKEQIRDSYEALAQNAQAQEEYKKANEYLNLYVSYKESIRNEERDKITRGHEVRHKTLSKEKENADLIYKTELAQRKKTNQQYVFALSLLAILIVAYIIYSRLRLNKEKDIANYERSMNVAMSKFVPMGFLKALGYDKITDVSLGDQTEIDVTVLFTDIRSFTTISESMSPNENFEFVREYAKRMGPIIERNHGFISQYLGDGIMAIFQSNPKDALLACIQMQEDIQEYNKILQERNILPIKVGMGMHTGPLVMGIIGDETRWDATLISDTVNTAARIESTTKKFEADILLSEDSAERIGEMKKYSLNQLGEVIVKGKTKPVAIFECIKSNQIQEKPKTALSSFV